MNYGNPKSRVAIQHGLPCDLQLIRYDLTLDREANLLMVGG